MDTGEFPGSNAEAGMSGSASITGKYVDDVDATDGLITVQYGNSAHALLQGETLLLSAQTSAGSVQWICRSDDIADKHLPAACR